jgi:hypothetical protein
VLCLNPTGNLIGNQSVLSVIRRVSRSAVSIESLVMRRRGASVQMVAPNDEAAAAMGNNFMDREPRNRVLASGYRQGLALGATERALNRATEPERALPSGHRR